MENYEKSTLKRGCSKTSVFGTASLDFREKPSFRPVFPGACPKLTGFGTSLFQRYS
jgi:hypothetical protein